MLGWWELAQAAAVGEHDTFQMPGQVVPQMPAIGDLHRLRGGHRGGFGVGVGPVAADHLDLRPSVQPGCDRRGLSIREQIHRATTGHVDHDGAVDVAAAQREVVDPQQPRSLLPTTRRRVGLRVGKGAQ